MKKLIFTVLFFIVCVTVKSQVVTHQNWKLENYQNSGSFYWGVTRSQYPDFQGKYYYYVYFYSNTYLISRYDRNLYSKASTYIRGISIYMHENKNVSGHNIKYNIVTINVPYTTCDWYQDPDHYVAWFVSYSPINNFSIMYDKVTAFDYSLY